MISRLDGGGGGQKREEVWEEGSHGKVILHILLQIGKKEEKSYKLSK